MGLNLQHASVVANMDLPWNPAVLEQRIGRVHRLGQHRPVRVVHFIAKGTIEEGMLALLSFKKALFAGVLDGGAGEVFLGGTRLKQFMDSVEKATGGISAAVPAGAGVSAPGAGEPAGAEAPPAGGPAAPPARVPARAVSPRDLADLLAAGAAFLRQLGRSLRQTAQAGPTAAPRAPLDRLIARDEATGQTYLRLPLPKPDTLQPLLSLLQALTAR